MKKGNKIIYWVATALLSFGMLGSGIAQILHLNDMNELINHVGYPPYFMYIIGVWKILGVIAILIPNFKLLKEWAYAGFFFLMTGALVSHIFMGDGGSAIFGPLFQTIFVILSWYFRPPNRKINLTQITA
ncbi:MAG: DoxX family protein [Bacteroidia bacterium]|nr:DoxX family protein [Bacteroidia bacterium]MBP9689959.1 DoxX family protein [Bacteroidia bacterium]